MEENRATNNSDNERRIARNTLMLYFRMMLIMLVSLYTSRVVLDALGEQDYGIYNVVGGVVAMFSMLTGALSASIVRFITYELGTGRKENLAKIFSSAVTIQAAIAVAIAVLAETAGIWFLNEKMNIPADRLGAAGWVLHFSIISFCINIISVPYNAEIIAHEKMSAFAGISIFEAAGKLATAFLISVSPIDTLVFYAASMCAVSLFVRLLYGIYCRRHFEECRYRFLFDGRLLKKMFGFAGWNFIGAASAVARDHGGNIVINLFCGPAVNAARGIAFQVSGALQGFMTNFMTALNPQITKSYAVGDTGYMMHLIYSGARLSFYMMLLVSLPVIFNAEYILSLWLKDVPLHTVRFVELTLIFILSESVSGPLVTAMLATGDIKKYQIIVGGLQMANLPVSYILLRSGHSPESVIIAAIAISQCCLGARLILLKGMIALPVGKYLRKVYLNIFIVSALSLIAPCAVSAFVDRMTFGGFAVVFLTALVSAALSVFYAGCSAGERRFVLDKISAFILKIARK